MESVRLQLFHGLMRDRHSIFRTSLFLLDFYIRSNTFSTRSSGSTHVTKLQNGTGREGREEGGGKYLMHANVMRLDAES